MLTDLETLCDSLKSWVAALDVACIDGNQAAQVVMLCAEFERVACAGKLLGMTRVEATGVYTKTGAKTPAEWLARVSGSDLNTAIQTVAVARAVEELPATEASLRSGTLSLAQAREVTRGAKHNPAEEGRLLDAAKQGHANVRREASRVQATTQSQEAEAARLARQRALRSMVFWTDEQGMACGKYQLEPKVGATVRKLIEATANQHFEAARKEGRRDTTEQYQSDAFVQLVQTRTAETAETTDTTETDESDEIIETDPPSAAVVSKVNVDVAVVIDYDALLRGHPINGERCDIPGVGPVPVAVAREYLLGGAFLKVLIAKGKDVRTVCHYGRHIPAELKTAIAFRDPQCIVAGCNRRFSLEHHHVHAVADRGETSLFNLRRICDHDHDLVTHRGFGLGPPDHNGKCQLIPPENGSSRDTS